MVVWNSTEAEFNTKDGEVILHSRHSLALNNSKKIPKIIGAVSILLIQEGDTVDQEIPQFRGPDGSINIEDSSDKGRCSPKSCQNPKITIPASLSFVPMPTALFADTFKSTNIHSNLRDKSASRHDTKTSDSEQAKVPRIPPVSFGSFNEQYLRDVDEVSSVGNQFTRITSLVETALPQKSQHSLPLNSSRYSYDQHDMYIKVEPRSDVEDNVLNSFKGTDTSNYNRYNNSLTSLPASGLLADLDVKLPFTKTSGLLADLDVKLPFTKTSGLLADLDVKLPFTKTLNWNECNNLIYENKMETQGSFKKLKLSRSKPIKIRKGIPQQRQKCFNSKNISRCAECNQCLSTYKELINHNAVHGKVSECPVCNRFFTTRGSFIRHSIAHVQKRSFPCPCCFACFTRKDNLKRHFNVHHKNSDWKASDSQHFGESDVDLIEMATAVKSECGTVSPKDKSERNSITSPSLHSTVSTNSPPNPPNLTKYDVKTSNLNSIVENLHGKKTQLPLLRSILTSDKGQNISKEKTDIPNIRSVCEKQEITKISNEPMQPVSYMCSECNIGFSSLTEMKCHIVRSHGEDTSVDLIAEDETLDENEDCIEDEDNDLDFHNQVYQPQNCSNENNNMDEHERNQFQNISESSDALNRKDRKGHIEEDNGHTENIDSLSHISGDSRFVLRPHEIKLEPEESDIESWVRNHNFNVMGMSESNKEGMTLETIHTRMESSTGSMYIVPSQVSSANRTIFPSPFEDVGLFQNKQKSMSNTFMIESKPKKRRITLHSEMTVCRLCGMYLESGPHIAQHGTQQHHGQIDASTCVVCFTKLSGYDSLYRHCQLHFGVMFDCQYCNSKFTRKDNLTRHIKNSHGKDKGLNETV